MVSSFENYIPSGIYSPDVTPLTTSLSQASQQEFSGNLCFQMSEEEAWKLTFRHGRLVWAIAANHRVRRWFCLTNRRCTSPPAARYELKFAPSDPPWEYQFLQRLLAQEWIERETVNAIVRQNICEVLFDLVQRWNSDDNLKCEITEEPEKVMEPQTFLGVDELLSETHVRWQAWCYTQLQTYTPSMASVIRHSEKPKRKVPEKTYRSLKIMLQEKRSLRELAILMDRDLIKLTQQLVPYERLGLIRFGNIPDIQIDVSGQTEFISPT